MYQNECHRPRCDILAHTYKYPIKIVPLQVKKKLVRTKTNTLFYDYFKRV